MDSKSIFNSPKLQSVIDEDSFVNRNDNDDSLRVRVKLLQAHKHKINAQCAADEDFIDIEIMLAESNRAFLQAIKILREIDSCQKPVKACSCVCNTKSTELPEHLSTLCSVLESQVHHQTSQDEVKVDIDPVNAEPSPDFHQVSWIYSKLGW